MASTIEGARQHTTNAPVTGSRRAALARSWRARLQAARTAEARLVAWERALATVGAPGSLVARARRTVEDTREEVRLCAALAEAQGERASPPPAPVLLPAGDPAELAASIARHGAVEGTLAACVASAAARRVTEPTVRRAAARLAEIATGRAELAWQALGWAVAAGGAPVRAAVARVLAEPFRPLPDDGAPTDPALAAFGQLASAERLAVAREAHGHVLAALARALLG